MKNVPEKKVMKKPGVKRSRFSRIVLRISLASAIVLAAASLASIFVLRSGWFEQKLRARLIAEIQKSSGARVELGAFRFDWEHLTATVAPLAIHGAEPSGEAPLFRADSVTLGLRVISMMERKIDLAFLRIDRPAVRIVFLPDGSNNLPSPRDPSPWTEDLLNLAVRRYEIDNGTLEYDGRAVPLNLRGERLRMVMTYDRRGPAAEKSYRGEFSTRTRLAARSLAPFEMDASAQFVIEKSRIEITRLHLAGKNSTVDLRGDLAQPRAPRGNLTVRAAIDVKEGAQIFAPAAALSGSAAFAGEMAIAFAPFEFEMTGRLDARSLGYTRDRFEISNANLRADMHMRRNSLDLSDISLTAPGANVSGDAQLSNWRQFHFDGNVAGIDLRNAVRVASGKSIPWNGTVAGAFTLDASIGQPSAKAYASLTIAPAPDSAPLQGQINANYDSGALTLANARIATANTQIEASGTPGRSVQLRVESKNLDDFLPVLALVSENAPKQLPLKLAGGAFSFRGTVDGPLDNPTASGNLQISSAAFENHAFDRFSGEIRATRASFHFQNATLARATTVVEGSLDSDGNAIAAQLTVRSAQIQELVKETGSSLEISGSAAASVRISGSVSAPQAEISGDIVSLSAFGEHLDRVHAAVRYSPAEIDVSSGEAHQGGAQATFAGAFVHTPGDWSNGDIRFEAATPGVDLASIRTLHKLQPSLSAKVDGEASGSVRLSKNALSLTSINGRANAHSVAWDRQPLGEISATAETRGSDLAIRAGAQVRDIKFDAQGSWRLAGDDPGSATLHVSRASVASLSTVILAGGPLEGSVPPFDGFVDGANATVSIALKKPLDFRAQLTIPAIHISPQPTQTLRLGVQAPELVVENSKPVEIAISATEARVQSAEFKARDTDLQATGAVAFDAKNTSTLNVRGAMNLIILQLFNPDLVARGSATVEASIRGSIKDPLLNGRMELKNASLYLGDLPNGVDNVNGSVAFDRNRATIEKLTAQTGGGTLNFSGFLGFGTPLVYRLQAQAQKVRVRYPEDVSVTFNSNLALNGTSDASTVSGQITLSRASFTPQADFAQVLAQAARPSPAAAEPSGYLRGMQFDVRIQSEPNFQLQTSLARNLQASVDLRLRGTPLRPALLGTASVNEGEIEIFGNRYTVNRGDIRFLNPVRIDPTFDMNLETRARAVTVNIAIAGTMQKMSVNYSSDPPLQPREIIALLAVNRAPGDNGLAPEAASASSTSLSEAGGGLIGQAISAQLSSRLQRFFGASRVRIDPTASGVQVSSLPQARLIVEQDVSRQVTLTYITNLQRTQEQIVQIEWDFSKRWSAVAVRDADGLFGIDFQYRKRFK